MRLATSTSAKKRFAWNGLSHVVLHDEPLTPDLDRSSHQGVGRSWRSWRCRRCGRTVAVTAEYMVPSYDVSDPELFQQQLVKNLPPPSLGPLHFTREFASEVLR